MKSKKILFIGLIAIGLLSQSCLDDFQDINTDPNSLTDTKPESLFAGATQNYLFGSRGQLIQKYGTTMSYMQYITNNGDVNEGSFAKADGSANPNPGGSLYGDYFGQQGRDYKRIIQKIDLISDPLLKTGYQNLRAVCVIMDTYDAWKVADVYGAMPYSQAFNVKQYPTPEYDFDYDLYKVFDKQLKESSAFLRTNAANQKSFANQDFFYKGNAAKWSKFANTLRIKIAQRYEKRDAANLASVLNDIVTNFGGEIISSNAESFGYDNLQGWNNNLDDINAIETSYVATFAFVEYLKSTNDPRIRFMVRENDFGDNYGRYNDIQSRGTAASLAVVNDPANNTSRFWGKHAFPASKEVNYGWFGQGASHTFQIDAGADTRSVNFISMIQTRLFIKNGGFIRESLAKIHTDETTVDGNTIKMRTSCMNYADVCFMMAEIAEKGGVGLGKTGKLWFEAGIAASFDDYKTRAINGNVPKSSTVVIGNFIANLPYNGLASIYSQSWVNNLIQPDEAWGTWKRTGYPAFDDYRAGQPSSIGNGSGIAYLQNLWTGTNNMLIPRRAALGVSEPSMQVNYDKAISAMKAKDASFGVSSSDTRGRVWWDKQ
jgi:hypothetical protein